MIKFEQIEVWGIKHAYHDLRKSSEYFGVSQRSQAGRVAYVLRLDSHPPLWFALEGRCR